MVRELTENDLNTRRQKSCLQRFPNAETGEHNPKCCRFPKACSPYASIEAYQAGNISENDIEPPRKTMADVLRETGLHTEQRTLEAMRVGTTFAIETKLMDELSPGDRQAAMDFELNRQRVKMEAYVLSDRLSDEEYFDTKRYSTPKTWWDMFKDTYALTWWLAWFVSRRPAQFNHHNFSVGVRVERFAQYPEANISLPGLGRPVRYERITRLTHRELEDLRAQTEMEKKRDKEDKDEKMWAFLLVPETIDDLAEYTGLPKKHFQSMYDYDQDFDLVTKIYLIPEGVGYRNPQE